jgi:hypothetical protein
MKQTAVEWLVNELTVVDKGCINKTYSHINKTIAGRHLVEIFDQAKEMDKQQKKDAFISAREYIHTTMFKYENAEQYYEETYGK